MTDRPKNDASAAESENLDFSPAEDFCAFCGSVWHTDVRDCPEIDPEQLIEAVHPGTPCQFDSPENLDGGWCVLCHLRRDDVE